MQIRYKSWGNNIKLEGYMLIYYINTINKETCIHLRHFKKETSQHTINSSQFNLKKNPPGNWMKNAKCIYLQNTRTFKGTISRWRSNFIMIHLIKTKIYNLGHTTRFWNNLHQVTLKIRRLESQTL